MKKLWILVAIFSLCVAREDPFTPLITPKDSIRPYYGETSVFEGARIEFPSSARLIKKVEVTFQNIDGSIQTRSIAVRGRIDWHTPLLISQVLNKNQIAQVTSIDNKTPPPSPKVDDKPKKTMVKAVDIPLDLEDDTKENITRESADGAREMRIGGKKTAQKITSDSMQDLAQDSVRKNVSDSARKTPSDSTKKPRQTPYKIDGKSIFIAYQGGLKRHYIMQNPYRIVMDFEINKKFYKQNSYTINAPHFKRLRYGLHTHFLRIVLELDGSYVYSLEKLSEGVKINVE